MTDFDFSAGDHFDDALTSKTDWKDVTSLVLILLGTLVVYIWLSA